MSESISAPLSGSRFRTRRKATELPHGDDSLPPPTRKKPWGRPRRLRARPGPPFTVNQILEWADDHFRTYKRWPNRNSGPVRLNRNENWRKISHALHAGRRGLPGGSSLARLLAQYRGVPNRMAPPPLTVGQILRWVDAFHARTGKWPKQNSGAIPDSAWPNWSIVDQALYIGRGGLPAGSSLARLLQAERGVPSVRARPRLTYWQILHWADQHHARTGRWPHASSGAVLDAHCEHWRSVDACLRQGLRGFRGGSSLAQLLAKHRGVANKKARPPLTVPQILAWADRFKRRHGEWPHARSGPIPGSAGDTWSAIANALYDGIRGLQRRDSLARLLERERGARVRQRRPPVSVNQILAWADAFHRRRGRWPIKTSGQIQESPIDSWATIDDALRRGLRRLRGGSSLSRLLARRRGVLNRLQKPKFVLAKVIRWMRRHRHRTGKWPSSRSGPIAEAPGETWQMVDRALYKGNRGLPGGSSLARLAASMAYEP
jgi:hypothetical protein